MQRKTSLCLCSVARNGKKGLQRDLGCALCRWSLRKQPTFGDATTGFPAKWRLRNEGRNSLLMTRHYPDLGSASDWLNQISHAARPIRSTTQIWVVNRHQYGISALVSQTSFGGKLVVASANVGCFLRLVVLVLLLFLLLSLMMMMITLVFVVLSDYGYRRLQGSTTCKKIKENEPELCLNGDVEDLKDSLGYVPRTFVVSRILYSQLPLSRTPFGPALCVPP